MNTGPHQNEANQQHTQDQPVKQPSAVPEHSMPVRGSSVLAITGFILSLLSPMVFFFNFRMVEFYNYMTSTFHPAEDAFWAGGLFIFAPLCSLLALIFSALGRSSSTRRGWAITGLVFSSLELVCFLLYYILLSLAFSAG